MNKKIDELLKQKMNMDSFEFVQPIPRLKSETLTTIKKRKKQIGNPSFAEGLINFLFNRYKVFSITFAIFVFVVAINFVCTLNVEKKYSKTVAIDHDTDTTLTVSSNTYLATLNQFTAAAELPANTTTALTCISTFVVRN